MADKKYNRSLRGQYAKLSYRIREQIKQLEQRYPESVALERQSVRDWEPLSQLPKNYTEKELKRRVAYAKRVLKSGELSLQVHRRTYSNAVRTLKEKGINKINNQNIGSFFRFLDDLRERGIAGYKSSKVWARYFTEAEKKGIKGEDLQKNIDYWASLFERNQNRINLGFKFPSGSGSKNFAD